MAKVLTYIFGYKTTSETAPGCFSVKFVTGMSKTFPKAYANKKDFWSTAIHEGDFSPLNAEEDDLAKCFAKYHAEFQQSDSFYHDLWANGRKFWYEEFCSKDQWIALTAMSLAQGDFAFSHMTVDDALVGKVMAGVLGGAEGEALELMSKHRVVAEAIYDDELRRAFG